MSHSTWLWPDSWGEGVALASSITSIIVLAFFAWRLGHIEAAFRAAPIVSTVMRASLACLPAAVVIAAVAWGGFVPSGTLPWVVALVAFGIVGMLGYVLIALRTGPEEIRTMFRIGVGWVAGRRRGGADHLMTPLRVAYLPPSLRPAGAERQMLALAERLPRDRFQVDFLAMSGPGEYDGRARAAGAKVRMIGAPTRANASRPERIAARGTRALRYASVARAQRCNIVDAWLYPVDLMAAFARPFTRTPVIVTGRRNLRDFYRPMGWFERGINRLADRFVDAVVVVNSDAVAADTLRHEDRPSQGQG